MHSAKIGPLFYPHPLLRDWNPKPEGCWGKIVFIFRRKKEELKKRKKEEGKKRRKKQRKKEEEKKILKKEEKNEKKKKKKEKKRRKKNKRCWNDVGTMLGTMLERCWNDVLLHVSPKSASRLGLTRVKRLEPQA